MLMLVPLWDEKQSKKGNSLGWIRKFTSAFFLSMQQI
jgi:hypothetical protein